MSPVVKLRSSCRLELNEFPLKNLNCRREGGREGGHSADDDDDDDDAIAASFSSFIIIHATLPACLPTCLPTYLPTKATPLLYDAAVSSVPPGLI